jgi:peroxiredoxin
MAQLRQDYEKFVAEGAEIIAIGPEEAPTFASFWTAHRMPFPGIPDPTHAIAKQYGQKVKYLKFGRMPAMMIIDKEGMIRYRHYGDSMSDIPTDQEVLDFLKDLNKGAY